MNVGALVWIEVAGKGEHPGIVIEVRGEEHVVVTGTSRKWASVDSIEIDPFGLQPGEAEQVARAISAALSMPAAAKVKAAAPKLDVSGAWDLRVNFLHGERTHRLQLKQDGGAITGDQTSQMFDSPVTGSLDADGLHLMFRSRYEGATIFYRLDGTVAGNKIEGNVVLGTGSDHHQGPINQAQFGSGQFQAVRAGGM